jgi:tetratricopeptide (TPR) repeat protein
MDELLYPGANERMREARKEYQLGRTFFEKGQWKSAARHFGQAERRSGREDVYQHLYRSCHGLSLVYCGDVSGLNLCRNAAGVETVHAEVFLNLALAELRLQHRKRACQAVSRGLKLDPRHKALLTLRRKMGIRRPPLLPFLKRDNPLNKWLGKATYRNGR